MANCEYENKNSLMCRHCNLKSRLRRTKIRGVYTSKDEAKKLGYKLKSDNNNGNGISQPYAWITCKNNKDIPVYRQGARSRLKGDKYQPMDDVIIQIAKIDILRWIIDSGGQVVLPDDLTKAINLEKKNKYDPLSVKYRKN